MKLFWCFVFCVFTTYFASGQGAANNWYFGQKAGLNFTTSPPTAVQNGNLSTVEGCATISDERGQLLFYTDGKTVYNQNHEVMENGSGLFGNASSTQSAIIIPKPGDPNIFYVFTMDSLFDTENYHGLNYSIVDFTTNPLGAVTQKNIHLLNYATEKLSAVIQGCDSDSVWVVTLSNSSGQNNNQNINTFFTYAVTPDGVNTTPVKSTLGVSIDDNRGNLKFSPNGQMLAAANGTAPLYLMDFDSETGKVANPMSIAVHGPNYAVYGVEFSPNNKFLYIDSFNNLDSNGPPSANRSSLVQYDLESTYIGDSQIELHFENYYRGSLQLGPDGKIYRALSRGYYDGLPYLGVIENPNEPGFASNYVDKAIFLGQGLSFQGLPPFNQSLFNTIDIIQNNLSTSQLNLCERETYTLKYDLIPGATYRWFLDGSEIAGETTNELDIAEDPNAPFPQIADYKLLVDLNDGSTCEKKGIAAVTYYALPESGAQKPKLLQCEDSETADGYSLFNLDEITDVLTDNNPTINVSFYHTQGDAETMTDSINPYGYENSLPLETLYARLTNRADCSIILPFDIEVSSIQAGNATLYACDENQDGFANFSLVEAKNQLLPNNNSAEFTFYKTKDGALLENPDELLTDDYINEIPDNQIVYARIENDNSCYAINEVNLLIAPEPDFELIAETLYCTNNYPEKIQIIPDFQPDPSQNYSYEWMPEGQTTPYLETNLVGNHTLTITNINTGCSSSKSVNIIGRDLPSISSVDVVDVSDNNTATITATGDGTLQYALDELGPYQESNIFTNLQPGFYTVYVKSLETCGNSTLDFSVIGYARFFTPNADGYHDYWQVQGISDLIQPKTRILIFDRFGKLIKQLDPLSQGWDGTYRGKVMPAEDYWFHVTLQDGREFKSHFTLKR
tara:strand:- start:107736 stop:110453 length:2718 start_codon:yes stop_codon:yes gene_type:complete